MEFSCSFIGTLSIDIGFNFYFIFIVMVKVEVISIFVNRIQVYHQIVEFFNMFIIIKTAIKFLLKTYVVSCK